MRPLLVFKKFRGARFFVQPYTGSSEVGEFLSFIAGGDDKELTVEQLKRWYDLIAHTVMSFYSVQKTSTSVARIAYYRSIWADMEAAENLEQLVRALEHLR